METNTPQWITGTLYGSAWLEIFQGNGNAMAQCQVGVRLQLEELEWQIAINNDDFHHQLYNQSYEATLSNIFFPETGSQPALYLKTLALEGVKAPLRFIDGITDFSEWPLPAHTESTSTGKFKLLNANAIDLSELICTRTASTSVYASCYQFSTRFTTQQIQLPNHTTLHIASEPNREHYLVSIWSNQDWSDYEEAVVLALELIAQSPSQKIQSIAKTENTLNLMAPYLPQSHHLTRINAPDFVYLEQLVHRLDALATEVFERFKISTLYHLHAKVSGVPAEIKYSMEMTWLEMVDGSNKLRAEAAAPILGIDLAGAEFLKEVRNKLLHEVGTLKNAIQPALEYIFSKGINGSTARKKHIEKIQRSLGLPSNQLLDAVLISLRLTERIDTAIWSYLGFPPQQIQRSKLVRWPTGSDHAPTQLPYYEGIKKAAEAASLA